MEQGTNEFEIKTGEKHKEHESWQANPHMNGISRSFRTEN